MEARTEALNVPSKLMLYDGVCGLCSRAVQFFVRRDRDGVIRYAALQGDTTAKLRAVHPEIPVEIDTLVFVEDGQVWLRSRAVLRAVAYLPAPWRWATWFRVVPAVLADPFYNLIARWRYRIWGKYDTCRIPTPDEAARFLD